GTAADRGERRLSRAGGATLHRAPGALCAARPLAEPRRPRSRIPQIGALSALASAPAPFLRSLPHRRTLRRSDRDAVTVGTSPAGEAVRGQAAAATAERLAFRNARTEVGSRPVSSLECGVFRFQ